MYKGEQRMTILEDFYEGNIHPAEISIIKNKEYKKYCIEAMTNIESLLSKLDDEEKHLFDEIENNVVHMNYISEREQFINGFGTGAKMVHEILTRKNISKKETE